MTLSDLSIKRPVFAWMLMILFVGLGAVGFSRLGVSQMPDVDFPTVTVSLTWEGASPEIMEQDVVDIIEDSVMAVEGIKEVSSTSRHGAASVTIEFDLTRDIDAALQDVQARVMQAQRRLPADLDPPVVSKSNPEDQPIMWVSLSGPRRQQELSDIVRNRLQDAFKTVPGVGEVMMGGYLNRNVRIWVDALRLEAYELSVEDVVTALRREHVEVPVGRIESASREMNVRSEGEALTLGDFRRMVIKTEGPSQVRLQDVAIVEDGLEDRRRIARVNGEPAQGMGIKKQRGANAVAVAKGIRQKMEEIRKQLDPDLTLGVSFDSTPYIEESIHEIEFAMVLACVLTGIVCWLFLGSLSSTLNIILAIPTSIVGTFAVMYFAGFTLNTFTLLALSLSVGIVVDDAIMVMENIYRHRQMGKSRIDAARDGAREIGFAAMAATVAIIAIFLPVAFTGGIVGKFLFQFGLVLSVAVALSLIEALTIAPARCAQFLDAGERKTALGRGVDAIFAKLASAYRTALAPAIRWRWAVMAAAMALFAGSLLLFPKMRRELVPSQDQSRLMIRLQTPVGSSIDYTDEVCREAEAVVSSMPEVKRYFVAVGGFGGGEVNTAVMFLTLSPRAERQKSMQELIAMFRGRLNAIPGLKAVPMDLSTGGFGAGRSFPIEVSIRGPEWSTLSELSGKMMEKMSAGGQVVDVDTDYQIGMPEVHIWPDRQKAADAGVSMTGIGTTVGALIGGTRVGKYKEGGRRYDVRLRLIRDQRLRPEDVRSVRVRSSSGSLVPLSEVVRVDEAPTLLSITRRGRERAISVFANVAPGASQAEALAEVERQWGELKADGYRIFFTGAAATAQETVWGLIFVMLLGLFIAYVVLASQFNSFIHPITVLWALPFSVSGALLALWLADISINIYSGIGLILLMGIAKKNSIILVDYTNQMREQGRDWKAALGEACPVRLRPILMTSVSTIAGAIPAVLALGPGSETRAPMAWAVIGGMIVSTLLTLFVVPAFYGMVEDVKGLFLGKAGSA